MYREEGPSVGTEGRPGFRHIQGRLTAKSAMHSGGQTFSVGDRGNGGDDKAEGTGTGRFMGKVIINKSTYYREANVSQTQVVHNAEGREAQQLTRTT